jgi:protein-disulfide isomerase
MPAHTPPPTGGPVPPARRPSAGRRRSARGEADGTLARAGASGSSGRGVRTLILWTAVAVVISIVVIGAAVILTRQPGNDVAGFRLIAPSVVTPADIPASGRTLGSPRARVTIDIYEDFRCTGCFAFRTAFEPTIETQYVRTGKARIVVHDFLTIDRGGNTESRDAANAALCAADQGRYWAMHDWLFANQSPSELPGYFTLDRLVAIGRAAGMDMNTFEPCVRRGTHDQEIQAEQAAAASWISYTPSIFVNGTLVVNPDNPQAIPTPEQIGAVIDRALK